MSDENQNLGGEGEGDELNQKPTEQEELAMLKQRAQMMGISFSNNIGIETLKQKIQEKMEGKTSTPTADPNAQQPPVTQLVDPSNAPKASKPETLRQKLIRENLRLVRLRITNLDPKKKDLPGEILTVANEYLGTVKKFVPFGEVTENGFHVPYCIYKMMKARKFLNIRTFKDKQNQNQIRVESNWVPEFALEVLPPLKPEEIAKLAAAQSAAGGVD